MLDNNKVIDPGDKEILITIDKLDKLIDDAWKDGYEEGYDAGNNDGYEDGYEDGTIVNPFMQGEDDKCPEQE